jgi:hypothetical protein
VSANRSRAARSPELDFSGAIVNIVTADTGRDLLLGKALALLVELCGATGGYLELRLHDGKRALRRRAGTVRGRQRHLARAMAKAGHERKGIVLDDPHGLCVPILNADPVGGIYLEGKALAARDVKRADQLARAISLVSHLFGLSGRLRLDDELELVQNRRIRESVVRHRGNVSSVARELNISRTRIYRTVVWNKAAQRIRFPSANPRRARKR